MTRFIYTIDVQKPTGSYAFLKSLENVLVVEGKAVNSQNPIETVLYDDRIENYSYVCTLDVDTQTDLLDAYYGLVKEHKLSLQYTQDDWVYLIPKRGRSYIGPPFAHPIIVKPPVYKRPDPIKFYKVGEGDSTPLPPSPLPPTPIEPDVPEQPSLYTTEWYARYLDRLRALYKLYGCAHSKVYVQFEAFVLTYGEYYKTLDEAPLPYFNTYELVETWSDHTGLPVVNFLGRNVAPLPQTYIKYIEPTLFGSAATIGESGRFYCALRPEEILVAYTHFAARFMTYYETLEP